MYAIVEVGGRQHILEPNKVVKVDRRPQDSGEEITLDKVLAIKDAEGELHVGRPYLDDATVTARIVEQGRERKITVMKFKAKKRYRRKIGHRQHFTALEILSIDSDSAATDVEGEADEEEPEVEAEDVEEVEAEAAEEDVPAETEDAEDEADVEVEEPETATSSAATGVDTNGS